MKKTLFTLALLAVGLTACAGSKTPSEATAAGDEAPAQSAVAADPIAAALTHPDRLVTDAEQDGPRESARLMAFIGIAPGMTVLDLYSGGGYNAELASFIVGPGGEVWAHNNTPFLAFAKDAIAARYIPGRLANVKRILAENNALDLPAEKFDVVLMIMVYHDIYHVHEESGWTRIDGPRLLAEIRQSMKPGAVLAVVDHRAAPGSPPETGETLHRIDPALARKEIISAGFVFEAESELLRNPEDDLTLHTFDPAIRGRTDKFVFRFRRP